MKPEDFKKQADAYNSMPFEYRVISSESELVARIYDLERLKERVKGNYLRELNWINDRIKNYKSSIK